MRAFLASPIGVRFVRAVACMFACAGFVLSCVARHPWDGYSIMLLTTLLVKNWLICFDTDP
jgi:hypothetical protein